MKLWHCNSDPLVAVPVVLATMSGYGSLLFSAMLSWHDSPGWTVVKVACLGALLMFVLLLVFHSTRQGYLWRHSVALRRVGAI